MSVIIRLQNLPWTASAMDIRNFFFGLNIPDGGVHIVGGDKGDAFIAFAMDEDARRAMLLDGGKVKDNYIKLFLSSKTEMQNVIADARRPPHPPEMEMQRHPDPYAMGINQMQSPMVQEPPRAPLFPAAGNLHPSPPMRGGLMDRPADMMPPHPDRFMDPRHVEDNMRRPGPSGDDPRAQGMPGRPFVDGRGDNRDNRPGMGNEERDSRDFGMADRQLERERLARNRDRRSRSRSPRVRSRSGRNSRDLSNERSRPRSRDRKRPDRDRGSRDRDRDRGRPDSRRERGGERLERDRHNRDDRKDKSSPRGKTPPRPPAFRGPTRCIHMEFLPNSAVYRDIRRFFRGHEIPRDGLKLKFEPEGGRKERHCYVKFFKVESAVTATSMDGEVMDGNKVRITPISEEEFVSVVDDFSTQPTADPNRPSPRDIRERPHEQPLEITGVQPGPGPVDDERILISPERRGPPGPDRQMPPGPDRRGPPGPDRRGPPDQDRRGPPGPDRRGPPDHDRRGPPGPDRRGPPDQDRRGPPDQDRRGPPDQERRGPPGPDRRGGPPDSDRRGPPPDRRGPPDSDRRGPPPDRRGPPPDRRGPPGPDNRGPPPDRRGPPGPEGRGPPPERHGLSMGDENGPPGPDRRGPPNPDRRPPMALDGRGPPPERHIEMPHGRPGMQMHQDQDNGHHQEFPMGLSRQINPGHGHGPGPMEQTDQAVGFCAAVHNLPPIARNELRNLFGDQKLVRGGLVADTGLDGMSSGTAFFAFLREIDIEMALKKNGMIFKGRRIEVEPISSHEFDASKARILAAPSNRSISFRNGMERSVGHEPQRMERSVGLDQQRREGPPGSPPPRRALLPHPGRGRGHPTPMEYQGSEPSQFNAQASPLCVRLYGLNFNSTVETILDFLHGIPVKPEQIKLLYKPTGEVSGVAFVEFNNPTDHTRALERDRHYIGKRYINVTDITKDDAQREIEKFHSNSAPPRRVQHLKAPPAGGGHTPQGQSQAQAQGLPPNTVFLSNLPYTVSPEEVLDFLKGFGPIPDSLRFREEGGKRTGEAMIVLSHPTAVEKAMEELNHQAVRGRIVTIST